MPPSRGGLPFKEAPRGPIDGARPSSTWRFLLGMTPLTVRQGGAMPNPPNALYEYARRALGISGNELASRLGVSRRTGQRWSGHGPPSTSLPDLARLVYPVD